MIQFQNLSYTYPETDRAAIRDVNLDIPERAFALLVGPSGAGKSTLLRCINGLVPHFTGGTLQGTVQVNGLNPVLATPKEMSRCVGFVFQDPEAQFVVDRVEDEIAFSLENAALPAEEMHNRVAAVLDLLGLTPLRNRRLESLSGGERQRVAIAAALALRPKILVLDEPTSQLDPDSAEDVLQTLVRLNQEIGLTVILTEHRLERVLPFVNLLIYLDEVDPGLISGPPRQVLRHIDLNSPLVAIAKVLNWDPLPLTIAEGKAYVKPLNVKKLERSNVSTTEPSRKEPYIQAVDLEVRYNNLPVLHGVSLDVYPGEIMVLMGPNGAGKTTLLRALIGLVPPDKGRVLVAGENITGQHVAEVCRQVGYLPQDPNALLFADTVIDELLVTLRNHNIPTHQHPPEELLARFGMAEVADCYPRDLSAGQRQRVALAAIMVTHPGALLLDEPTRGLDYAAKQDLVKILKEWREEGIAILLVTHDVELAATTADRVVLLEEGKITADGEPAQVLGSSPLFTPQVSQLFPGKGWLTPEDVLLVLGEPAEI